MLATPVSLTYNSVAYSLPLVGSGLDQAKYADADSTFVLTTGHSTTRGGRTRSRLDLRFRKVAADVFQSTLNAEYSASLALTGNFPTVGFSAAERALLVDTFLDALRANTDTIPLKVLAGEL